MGSLIYTLIVTHITILCVTLFLHREQTHKGIVIHPLLSHPMRFWLWLTTGMVTKQWVAIHRMHHAYTDTEKDPHSPQIHGIWKLLFGGAFYYHVAAKDKKMIENFSRDVKTDFIENLYTKYNFLGILIMLWINLQLFGNTGLIIWIVQMLWIPFFAAGVVNGVGHYLGYRNTDTKDSSRNIMPIGLLIGGEELHNNHHHNPASPKLSEKWYEFDIGWFWIKLLSKIKLIKIKEA
jgi:stearoyl-CoA desaturase (Delta-9 desaturase)